ncbi:hypothetical protein B0H19DRAFT_537509 [Mycena capillaripes]|nr:hypothetical protein B0H19DRAFT_537509 [Mycena capillaripes]
MSALRGRAPHHGASIGTASLSRSRMYLGTARGRSDRYEYKRLAVVVDARASENGRDGTEGQRECPPLARAIPETKRRFPIPISPHSSQRRRRSAIGVERGVVRAPRHCKGSSRLNCRNSVSAKSVTSCRRCTDPFIGLSL